MNAPPIPTQSADRDTCYHCDTDAEAPLAGAIQRSNSLSSRLPSLPLSPNPPKDTDGRREDRRRGMRELQGRWPGLDWGRWEVGGGSSVTAQAPNGRLRELGCAGWQENRQQGTPAELVGASLRGRWVSGGGRRQAGSGMARSRARARLNCSSQGQRRGRCRVNRRAERVIRPAKAKTRRLRVLVVTIC